ncbi:MAG: hypothetical protein HFK04_00020 [Oscillospiraceae bacterium]|nr:hypothetical protein [Oscillospiraceae bacterium]
MIAVNTQTMIFFQSLLLGAALGMVYDLFRIFRVAVPLPSGIIVAEDVLYFVFSGFVSFFFAMTVNFGQIRFFILLGETLGFLLYYLTLGSLVMRCAQRIIAAARWLLRLVARLFSPVVWLFCWLGRKGKRILGKWNQNLKKAAQKNRKHLQRKRILLYNYFHKRKSISPKKREKIKRGK